MNKIFRRGRNKQNQIKVMEISCLNKKNVKFVQDDHPSMSTVMTESKRFDSGKIVGETPLFQELNTFYKCMSFAGLLYLQNPIETLNQQKSMKQKLYMVYQWFFDTIMVMNALRYFALYRHSQDTNSFLVTFVYHIYMVMVAVLSCMRPYLEKHISLFITKIYSHKLINRDMSSINRLAKFTRFYVFSVCAYGFLSSIASNYVAPIFYQTDLIPHSYPFRKSSIFFYPALLIFGYACILGTVRVYVMLGHCLAMCHFMSLEYIHLAQRVRSRITDIEDDDGYFLEAHRIRFEALNNLLKHVNLISNTFMMSIIFFCLFELCIMFYGLLQDIEYIDLYSIALWAGLSTLFSVLLIGAGISLFSSAHQLTDDLYAIDLRNLSSEASLKVSIFLARLTGSPIGISVAGLFVIDHSTILMLTGTLLTYIIVVIQTKAPDCGCLNNNNTTTIY